MNYPLLVINYQVASDDYHVFSL